MRSFRRIATSALLGALVISLLTVASAGALLRHVEAKMAYGEELGGSRMALDQSDGNVYVTNGSIQVFGEGGAPPAGGLTSKGPTETPHQASFTMGIAVDNSCYLQKLSGSACTTFDASNQDIYVAAPEEHAIDKYKINAGKLEYVCQFVGWGFTGKACLKNSSSGREAQPTEGEFAAPEAVAVDSEGNVYIGSNSDHPMKVYEFDSSGNQVRKITSTVESNVQNIAVDGAGDVYMSPYPGEDEQKIVEMKKTGPTTYVQQPLSGAKGGALTVNAAGKLYSSHIPSVVEFNAELKEEPAPFGEGAIDPGYADTEAFAVNDTTGDVLILGSTPGYYNGQVHTFTPLVLVPDVALTTPVIESKSITVKGTVNPDGLPLTECEIELDPPGYYGGRPNTEFQTPCLPDPGSSSTPVNVSATFSELIPNAGYVAYIYTANANGKNSAPGEPTGPGTPYATLMELPMTIEPTATGITRSSAVLGGTVNPENDLTSYHFVWGTSTDYTVSTPPLSAGGDRYNKPVQSKIAGLKPGVTYHYKLVAENGAGVAESEDKEFTTSTTQPPSVSGVTITGLEPGAAEIIGTVHTNGLPSSYEIDFGINTEYETKLYGEVVGESQTVLLNLIYLVPEKTYHYRIVVRNEDGVAESADQTFETPKYPLKIPQILPQVSALIAAFPTEEGIIIKETVKPKKGKGKGKGKKGKGKKHKSSKKAKKSKKKSKKKK